MFQSLNVSRLLYSVVSDDKGLQMVLLCQMQFANTTSEYWQTPAVLKQNEHDTDHLLLWSYIYTDVWMISVFMMMLFTIM